jgi:hypothetical protein
MTSSPASSFAPRAACTSFRARRLGFGDVAAEARELVRPAPIVVRPRLDDQFVVEEALDQP